MTELDIGLVGCGAVVHLNYALALRNRSAYRVRWVTDLNDAQANSAAELFGAEVAALDAIADRADVVIISTPPSSHAELVRACLKPGRVILCEKPFTTTSAEARDLANAAAETGTHVCVGHFRRTFPQVELARQAVGAGLIGDVEQIVASEGGRFAWNAVSNYTTSDATGGVLWDTGSHTIDMAIFAAGLDEVGDLAVDDIEVTRDRSEPSHEFSAAFKIATGDQKIDASLRLSRRDTLPNLISIRGSRGRVEFVVGLDTKVRLHTEKGSMVLTSDREEDEFFAMVDVQVQRIVLGHGREDFAARRFVGQVAVLEALSNA